MHGLVNRGIESFARATYGDALWVAAATASGVDPRGFGLVREYPDEVTGSLLRELSRRLSRSPRDLVEDIGAWAAAAPSIRRLLRFSAPDFDGFILALPELRERARMVVRGLCLPEIDLRVTGGGWTLSPRGERLWLHAMSGLLHAMADDYGVLAVIEVVEDRVVVTVPLTSFSEGRPFSISDPNVGAAR